jgi:hypothetical protein
VTQDKMSEEKRKRGTKTVNLNTRGIGKPNLDTLGLALHRTQTLTLIWTCGSSPQRVPKSCWEEVKRKELSRGVEVGCGPRG